MTTEKSPPRALGDLSQKAAYGYRRHPDVLDDGLVTRRWRHVPSVWPCWLESVAWHDVAPPSTLGGAHVHDPHRVQRRRTPICLCRPPSESDECRLQPTGAAD